jgi:hypothetical protein
MLIEPSPGGALVPAKLRSSLIVLGIIQSALLFAPCLHAQDATEARPVPHDFEKTEQGESLLKQRDDWFYQQRAYPHAKIPTGARLNALNQLRAKIAAEHAQAANITSLTTPSPAWTFLGPEPIDTPYTDPVVSGRVSAIAIDPTSTSTVYLGAAQGGVWKSTNSGSTWTNLTDNQASLAIGSITIDPTNHLTIYVGTGEENFSGDSYYGAGILKSTNGGATWTHICGPFCGPVGQDGFYGGGARIGSIAVDPANNQILLAGVQLLSEDGIYRSTDGGTTWTQVLSGNPGTSVFFDPANPSIAYAALGSSFAGGTEGVYESTNAGSTWTAVNGSGGTAIDLTNAGRIVLADAPSSPTTIYASVEDTTTSGLVGMFKTTDGGVTWNNLSSIPDYCTPQCWYDNAVAVDPVNPDVVYAGGAYSTTLVRSLDGGNSWVTLQAAENFGFVHADVHALVFPPHAAFLFLGSDGGAYITNQPTAANPSFTALNTTLGITQFYGGLASHPTNPSILLGGTQDNGSLLYSGKNTWHQVTCGDGGFSLIDPNIPTTMYTTCEYISILKSTSSGSSSSWSSAESGIDTSDRSQFIPPLVMDPSRHIRLYFGTYRVYQTLNSAASWTAISPDLTNGGNLTTIAVAPASSSIVYAGSSDSQVQVTTNAGSGASATWKNISAGLPPRFVTQIVGHPRSSSIAYVTFSGFTGFGDSLGHVFKTTNNSAWTDISGDLPNTPVNSIAVDPDLPAYIFVGTDVGVFYTTNGGTKWFSLVDGLPNVAVLGLTLNNTTHLLEAATHGRGVWSLDFTTIVPVVVLSSISPATATAGSASVNLSLTGKNFTSSSVVLWNGSPLATTFVSSTSLTATIPSADLNTAGTFPITVQNPTAPASVSAAINFTVTGSAPPPLH